MLITSKYTSACRKCGRMTVPGDRVGWEPGQKGVWCEGCTPTASRGRPKAVYTGETGSPKANGEASHNGNGYAPYFKALLALEEAVIESACTTMTPELAAGWEKVQKLKALALAPGTEQEGRTALKLALIQAIKLAF